MARLSVAITLLSGIAARAQSPNATATGGNAEENMISSLASLCPDVTTPASASGILSCSSSIASDVEANCNTDTADCSCIMANSYIANCIPIVCPASFVDILTADLGLCPGASATATGPTTSKTLSDITAGDDTSTTEANSPTTAPGSQETAADDDVNTTESDDFGAIVTPALGIAVAGIIGVVGVLA